MRVPGAWRLSTGDVPVPTPPSTSERRGEITRIRAALLEEVRNQERYAPDNTPLWTAYFTRLHEEQLASTNCFPLTKGRNNFDDRKAWWGVPGRTLHVVLEHIEGGNNPPLEYPPISFSCRCGGSAGSASWLPRRMASGASSSSSGSRSSGTPPLAAVKAEPVETPNRRRTRCGGNLIINEGGPTDGRPRLVRPKKGPVTPAAIKPEHAAMPADFDTGLQWACDDYVREEMERKRRTLEEIVERRPLEEADVIILSDDEKETLVHTTPTQSPRSVT
ncbi:Homeobox protein KNOX3 [Hordeum vulgare]|nr:Homeobox protein KNOX3 [Hordeum vulgare]